MAITLATVSLPDPSTEDADIRLVGTSYELANGTVQHDNISAYSLHIFTLSWRGVTKAIADNIVTAYNNLYTTAIPTYTDIRSGMFSVTGLPNRPPVKRETVNANPLRYNVTINFMERVL